MSSMRSETKKNRLPKPSFLLAVLPLLLTFILVSLPVSCSGDGSPHIALAMTKTGAGPPEPGPPPFPAFKGRTMKQINHVLVPVDLQDEKQSRKLIETSTDLAAKFAARPTVVDIDFDSSMLVRFDDIQDTYAKAAQARLRDTVLK